MDSLNWLFDNKDPLDRGPYVKRLTAMDDFPSKPETTNFKNRNTQTTTKQEVSTNRLSDPKEDAGWMDEAKNRLQSAVDQLKDIQTIKALETIIEEISGKTTDIQSSNVEKKMSTRKPIERVGTVPEERNPIKEEVEFLLKAQKEGMTLEEIREADQQLERIFDPDPRKFRRKFAAINPNRMPSNVKTQINKRLNDLTTPGYKTQYFNGIPIDEIMGILREFGYTLLQEDNTEWSGLLLGEDVSESFTVGSVETMQPLKNTVLSLSWHKMPSNRYEIVAYLG